MPGCRDRRVACRVDATSSRRVSETELLISEVTVTATYTFDVFCTLDGFGSYEAPGDWGGYWGKHGPELLEHRLGLYDTQHRMVFGATTMRVNLEMLGPSTEGAGDADPWVERMRAMPTTVISSTLEGPLDWRSVVAHGSFRVLESGGSESDAELYARALRLLRAMDPAMGTAGDAVSFRTAIFGVHLDEISGRQARSRRRSVSSSIIDGIRRWISRRRCGP